MSHTPGPWYATDKYGEISIETKDALICRLYTHGQTHGNASLITAAPDMLEALEELLFDTFFTDAHPGAVKKARAAIAKATGETEK